LKVLHIITGISSGGAETVLCRLTAADKDNTHQIVSLTDCRASETSNGFGDVPVLTLHMSRGRRVVKGLLILYRLIRSSKPDVVQTWMYHADLVGGAIARLGGRRQVVWGIRNYSLDSRKTSFSTRVVAWLCGVLSRMVPHKIVSCAHHAVQAHVEIGFDRKKMVVIPNGYDLTELAPSPAARARRRTEWGIGSDTLLFGMVARWDPLKDHANLIRGLAHLQKQLSEEWCCILIGSGMTDSNSEAARLLEQWGLRPRVRLLGSSSDIASVMNALDIHVLSSAGEAFPNVVAEAMACGTPCVVTDVGDAALIVGDTGWVVPPGDSIGLGCALLQAATELRGSEDWRLRKAAARQRIVANFSLEKMVHAYRSVWEEAAAQS